MDKIRLQNSNCSSHFTHRNSNSIPRKQMMFSGKILDSLIKPDYVFGRKWCFLIAFCDLHTFCFVKNRMKKLHTCQITKSCFRFSVFPYLVVDATWAGWPGLCIGESPVYVDFKDVSDCCHHHPSLFYTLLASFLKIYRYIATLSLLCVPPLPWEGAQKKLCNPW